MIISIYRRGNFVCHNLGCTSIYRKLSDPSRSLSINDNKAINIISAESTSSPPSQGASPSYNLAGKTIETVKGKDYKVLPAF